MEHVVNVFLWNVCIYTSFEASLQNEYVKHQYMQCLHEVCIQEATQGLERHESHKGLQGCL